MIRDNFKVFVADLSARRGTIEYIDGRNTVAGGSGLAAALFLKHGDPSKSWDDPGQPLIFAIGPLTGYFPLMSKTVCAFKSPYHDQYAESHAGGRSALALRFADYDALVIIGKASRPACLVLGARHFEIKDVHYLWGKDQQTTGKILRHMFPGAGHRSILRIGPAGERGTVMGCINVDSNRHFGRLGGGSVMGSKGLKAVVILGDDNFLLPANKDYAGLFQDVHRQLTDTDIMHKYHNLGTPANVSLLNDLKALPIRNLQQTSDPAVEGISGERFAHDALLRNAACAGCPVGCIHIGYVRERFKEADNRYLYRQVSYDHELIFSLGSMLGITDCFAVLGLIDSVEKMGLDAMSAGVALAWATEAREKGIVSDTETIVPLSFGDVTHYKTAVEHLAFGVNDFYRTLGKGTAKAAAAYGGDDFACVLGQEMAGYATGEAFFAGQALGFRHSHLDSAGYSYDQKPTGKTPGDAADFLVSDERGRVFMTSMVACLFARSVYTEELLAKCLGALGYETLASTIPAVSEHIQRLRWNIRFATGYNPKTVSIPRRFIEVVNWKGPLDKNFLDALMKEYADRITALASQPEDPRL